MNAAFIWLAYLATYGLIVGYVAAVWIRVRSHRGRPSDRTP